MVTETGTCLEEQNNKEKEHRKMGVSLRVDRCEGNS